MPAPSTAVHCTYVVTPDSRYDLDARDKESLHGEKNAAHWPGSRVVVLCTLVEDARRCPAPERLYEARAADAGERPPLLLYPRGHISHGHCYSIRTVWRRETLCKPPL